MIIGESAVALKRWIALTGLKPLAQVMMLRMVLGFLGHRGRMTCAQAAGSVASQPVHRGQLTRFLAGRRWQRQDFNAPLRQALLALETQRGGQFVFIIDATLCSQAGQKTENTFSTGNRQQRPRKGRRYQKYKHARKTCHSFTFGLLITPSGLRLPFQIPHYTKAYCQQTGRPHRTTAEAAAGLIRQLPLPETAQVVVLGDTAYDAHVVQQACAERGYEWIVPANPERVFDGSKGHRPRLRSRLKEWTTLKLQTVRLRFATGKFAGYRRLSRWRIGPKQKPRAYYAHQETATVRHVGRVRLVFSTTNSQLQSATPDDVKLLMTNAHQRSLSEVIELYSLRWQIELFFKELKSTLGLAQYRFRQFTAVEAWVNLAITTVLFLEHQRAQRLTSRRSSAATRAWWSQQRLYGLATAFRQDCQHQELKYLARRLNTPGGITRLRRLLTNALPKEYRPVA
jgi:Transposase DDE domain